MERGRSAIARTAEAARPSGRCGAPAVRSRRTVRERAPHVVDGEPGPGAVTFATCGAKAGEETTTSAVGPSATTSPAASTTTRSAASATNSTSWVESRTERPCRGEVADRLVAERAWRSSRDRGWARRAAAPGGSAVSCTARTSASRWPSTEVARVESPGRRRGRCARAARRRCPRPAPALAVRLRALGRDGVEVEQVRRALRDEADRRAVVPGRRASAGRRRRRLPTRTVPDVRVPLPCSAHSSEDLPGAVAAHQRGHLARPQVEVDARDRHDVAVPHHDAARPHRRRRRAVTTSRAGARRGGDRSGGASSASAARRPAPARRASRTDSGSGSHPAQRPSSHHRRGDVGVAHHRGGRAVGDACRRCRRAPRGRRTGAPARPGARRPGR